MTDRLAAILARTVESPSGCLEWQGSRHRQGYGMVQDPHRKRNNVAHRVVFELLHGVTLTRQQVVRHSCDNPPCINPEHLSLGTQRDNSIDAQERGRYGTKRLTVEQARAVKQLLAEGVRYMEIARRLGISVGPVRNIGQGVTYKWVAI